MNREKSQQQLNLATLRRIDPAIVDVMGNSAHVAVYKFDDATKSWHKRDVEGSFFVVKRSEPPNYRIIVLNRLSIENLTEDVTSNLLVQLSGPYMIYRNHLGITTGIWFYEESDKEKISNLLNSIIQGERTAHDNNNVAALAGLLTSIKDQAAAAASPYPPNPIYNQPPPFPYPPPSQLPYQPPYQPPPQHYPPPPATSAPSPHFQPPMSHHHPNPSPAPPPYAPIPLSQPPPSPLSQPPNSQLPPGDVIANLISSIANQHLPPNLNHSHTMPNMFPPGGQPTNPPNYEPSSPKAPPKAFAYDANSPFPKLLSPSNISAKNLLQQPTPPTLALGNSQPFANPAAGLPQGRASPAPLPPTTSLNGSSGSVNGGERERLGGSGGLSGSGGIPKMSKQQLKQALLNLVHDDRFMDLVYNEYVAQR